MKTRSLTFLAFFFHASFVIGQTWGAPVNMETINGTGGMTGSHPSLEIANGNPAIAYHNYTHHNLMYMRANDASGSTWGSPQLIDETGFVGFYLSFAIINGKPAISYFDWDNGDLKYVRANDASGIAVHCSLLIAHFSTTIRSRNLVSPETTSRM